MDKYVKLAYDSLAYYLNNKKYLNNYDDYFLDKNEGIIVKITNEERIKGESGSIFPTRKNMALDIIYESVNAGFFDRTYLPITKENLYDHSISVYEFSKVEQIKYIEDFLDYDGICINYMDENFIFYRSDYKSDMQMFEEGIREANLDSWDVFSIYKFKLIIHSN